MEIICIVCIVCIVFIKSFGKILTTKDKNYSNQGFTGHNVPSAWGEDNHRGSTACSWKVSVNKQNKQKHKIAKITTMKIITEDQPLVAGRSI